MVVVGLVILIIYIINLLLLLLMILVDKKQPQTVFSWFVVLTLLPITGFLLYLIFGGGLSIRVRMYINKKKRYTQDYYQSTDIQSGCYDLEKMDQRFCYAKSLINFVKSSDNSIFTINNDVSVFVNGEQKIEQLKKDLLNAKQSINMEYYIFDQNGVGKEIMQILCDKARNGVKVKLLYDSVGSLKSSKKFFKELDKSGGETAEFFPPFMGIRLINFKINYRNHRKIVVIDGKIAYTGGINIRDDHMGKDKLLSPWRDTHIRITGPAVWDLQNVFFNDYRYAKNIKLSKSQIIEQGYFNKEALNKNGNVGCQIITSGPEDEQRYIEDAYIKMINIAKKRIYLQTPYFITDEVFIKSLVLAQKSGVDVRVMIPGKPDKKSIYYVTLSYIQKLIEQDIKVYFYNGFIHSKTLLIDDICVAIGSCNMDNRSFLFNFETTALLYNKEFVNKNAIIFKNDIKHSKQVTLSSLNKKFLTNKSIQSILRLFSSLM